MTTVPDNTTKFTCQACGVGFTDPSGIDVEDRGPDDRPGTHREFRRATSVCAECLDLMDADMWVSRAGWESLHPIVPWEGLEPIPS